MTGQPWATPVTTTSTRASGRSVRTPSHYREERTEVDPGQSLGIRQYEDLRDAVVPRRDAEQRVRLTGTEADDAWRAVDSRTMRAGREVAERRGLRDHGARASDLGRDRQRAAVVG